MNDTIIAPMALHGWYALHQFFRVSPPGFVEGGKGGLHARGETLAGLLGEWDDLGEDGWSGLYRIVGGGSDLLLLHFRPTLDALGEVQRTLRTSDVIQDLESTRDYVSVVELGLYAHTHALLERAREEAVEHGSEAWQTWVEEALEEERGKAYVQRRLHPRQPDNMPYVCFYPMDKRRAVGQNWYTLTVEERATLMRSHATTGRRYAGRVSQVITGSVGLDDWEWAVTLFAGDPLAFKDLVTEMRYDEVSSVYADFGDFRVGHRIPASSAAEELAGD